MSNLTKLANDLDQARHDQNLSDLLNTVSQFPVHEKHAVLKSVELVKEAEDARELPAQTPYGRLSLAVELTKAAAISGNEEFRKEAANAFAAGQLAAHLLEQAVAAAEQQNG